MAADPGSFAPAIVRPSAAGVGVPLFHAAWLFALGIVAVHSIWLRPSYVLVALCIAAVLCGMAALRAPRIAWPALGLLWCLLGAWCAEMQPQPAPEPKIVALSDGLIRTVEGTITDASPLRSDTQESPESTSEIAPAQALDLNVSAIEVVTDSADELAPVEGKVRLTVRWPAGQQLPTGFGCGERIRADARLTRPEVYRDPGAWNRSDYLLDQGITSTATVDADRVTITGTTGRKTVACRIAGWRHGSIAKILLLPAATSALPVPLQVSEDDAVMLSAMVTGDRTYLTHSMRVGFERTGSFHMLVVSGLHVAIVAGFVFWIATRLRLPRIPGTLITIAAAFAYALFTGFGTPVQRSLWMVTLYLLGRLVYRERNVLNTIGFASLCLMAASPRALFDSSLQMTLLAVISIGGIAAPLLACTVHPYLEAARDVRLVALDVKLAPRLAQFRVVLRMFGEALAGAVSQRIGLRIFPALVRATIRCFEALVVSAVVELAMTLPMAVYFHRITVFALPVNVLILPLLVILVPAAFTTLLLFFVSAKAALIPAAVTAVLLHAGIRIVQFFGSKSFGDLRIPAPWLSQMAIFCALLSCAVALARYAMRSGLRWPRRAACAALLAAAIAVVIPRPIDHPHDALLVEAIDVGQGDSILLISPEGETMLIDGGGFGGGPHQAPQNFDIGEEVVSPVLWSRGIRHLDVVALTHAHSDHMGGLPSVLRNFKPNELWVGNNPPVAAYEALLNQAHNLGTRLRTLEAGDVATLGTAKVRVLAPFPGYVPAAEPGNNDSLVLHVTLDSTSVLLEGDAEAPIETAMLTEQDLASTVLKVGHHGSVTSTGPEFLARVAPQWAVISCGLHNRYGHPRVEVLGELQTAHVHTFSTDITGASCFQLDGKNVKADSFCGMPKR